MIPSSTVRRAGPGAGTAAVLVLAIVWAPIIGCGDTVPDRRPRVMRVLPGAARPGSTVSIWGDHLGTTGTVLLAGAALPAVRWTPTRIEFRVPTALEEGVLEVRVHAGELALEPQAFTVVPLPPVLARIEPERTMVGEELTLHGTHFGKRALDGAVLFGGVAAPVVSWSPTRLQVKVPRFASPGPLAVKVGAEQSPPRTFSLLAPAARRLVASGALPGSTVTVEGEHFGATPGQVLVGPARTPARLVKWGADAIAFEVPALPPGAGLPVTVANESGESAPMALDVYGHPRDGVAFQGAPGSRFVDLVLDGSSWPHACWYDADLHRTMTARWTGLAWKTEPVDAPADPRTGGRPDAGWYPSMYLEPDGTAHLTSFDLERAQLVHAAAPAGPERRWTFAQPDPERTGSGLNSCVRVDREKNVLVAFLDQSGGGLLLARRTAGRWSVETVEAGLSVGHAPSLALDPGGHPHLAYLDAARRQLKYAHRDASSKGWIIERVTEEAEEPPRARVGPPRGPAFPSLALDRAGTPHIAYMHRRGDGPPGDADGLRLAVRRGGKWETRSVESGDGIGCVPSLAFTEEGRAVVGYFGRKDGTVRLALANPDGSWKVRQVAVPGLAIAEEPGAARMALGKSDALARFMFWTDAGGARQLMFRVMDTATDAM